MDIALTDQATVGVARKLAVGAEIAVRDEIFCLPRGAETQTLELLEKDRRERVVDHRRVDIAGVSRAWPNGPPDIARAPSITDRSGR